MQSILREKLLAQALKLAEVSKIYRTDNSRFVETYFNWLEQAEKDLSGLRSPIITLLQSEKATLNSVLDGFLPHNIQPGRSIRKIQKAVAAQSLEKISREIYSKIEQIDLELNQLNEKLCHALAVLASKDPAIYASLDLTQRSVDKIWHMLATTPETFPMYNYFCAKLAATDVNYLLMDIFQKIIGNIKST